MGLILDAAYPPADVNQWIATLRLAGAEGCMAYIYDLQIPGNRWTPDYCRAIQDAGYGILPVYVWGPAYPAIGHARDVMAAYGWSSGPVMGDIEAGSWPSEAYFSGWCSDLRSHGYLPVVYGTASTLDARRRYADRAFLASYVQRQIWPMPDINGLSYDGWQYANRVTLNGVEVDASVTSIPLIGAADMTPDELKAALREVLSDETAYGTTGWAQTIIDTHDKLDKVYHLLLDNAGLRDQIAALKAELDTLKANPPVASHFDLTVTPKA